jgi:hypothetical protein
VEELVASDGVQAPAGVHARALDGDAERELLLVVFLLRETILIHGTDLTAEILTGVGHDGWEGEGLGGIEGAREADETSVE